MTFDIKKFIIESRLTTCSRLSEAQVKGVKLTVEEQDWLMFIIGPTSKRGPISREMAIKLIQKDIKDGGAPGEVAISKKLLKRIQRG